MSAPPAERRSAADLQRILDSLIGDAGCVLSAQLPDVLTAYETSHNLAILDASDHDGLRTLCAQHPDLELGPKELLAFLSAIPKPVPITGSPPHSAPLPPSTYTDVDHTPVQRRHSRRNSDRIRSPSDSSSSSSEDAEIPYRHRMERHTSAPAQSQPFPSSGAPPVPGIRPLPPKRTKTLSDPSRLDSPLAVRNRHNPPSAFSSSGGFARPSPASKRRRGSRGSATGAPDDSYDRAKSPEIINTSGGTRTLSRTVSASSVTMEYAPTWEDNSPKSPVSQEDGLDSTSFHERAKSPETEGDVEETPESEVGDEEFLDEEDDQADIVGEGRLGAGADSLNPRLSRISTDSTTSLRTSHDKLRALQKLNAELARKLKESERQLAVIGSENERLVEDLQDKLEEARSEIAQRKKEDKDMKGKDRAQLIQIAGFEADIQSLQRNLEHSKTHHTNMQKMYQSQCDEAQRLRDMLRDRDNEILKLESEAQIHEADEEKVCCPRCQQKLADHDQFDREIQALEGEIKRLEGDLSVARRAESVLEVQKLENLQLKETIDRMRFDLEEARAAQANGAGHGRTSTTGSSVPATMSRNLGDELSRRLMDAENKRLEEEEGESDSVVETIVTTQRTRKLGHRKTEKPDPAPAIRIEEGIKEYEDAATETDPVEPDIVTLTEPAPVDHHSAPLPPYSAEPEPLVAKDVLDKAHPRNTSLHGHSGDPAYDALVDALGVRCEVIEKEIQMRSKKEAELVPRPSTPGKFFSERRRKLEKPGTHNYVFYTAEEGSLADHVGRFAVWTVAAFAIGLVAGSHFAVPHGIHPRDFQLFSQMNTIAAAAGAGEGFLPMGQRGMLGFVENGARMVAGRVPT
ncbi:hypothetical protein P7C73_g5304, partial [Tremellales sp. Uapishka_1]